MAQRIGAETAEIEDFSLRMNASITLIILYLRLRNTHSVAYPPAHLRAPFFLLY